MSVMDAKSTSLEEFLAAVLRGAAKIIGCGSTNLVLINEQTQEIRIRLGTMAVANPMVSEIEQLLGGSLHEICVPVREAQSALAFRSWRERAILETSSLSELVGTAFGPGVAEQLEPLVGDLRFICVPALSLNRCYGVLLFQKEGKHPFTRQQREVILRYARRIGAILEADLTGQGRLLFSRLRGGPDYLLFDQTGRLRGSGTTATGTVEPELVRQLSSEVAALHGQRDGSAGMVSDPELAQGKSSGVQSALLPFALDGEPSVLCVVHGRGAERTHSLESALLELTLGEVVPALFVDPALCITSCNEAVRSLLGYEPHELVGRPLGSLLLEPAAVVEALGQQIVDLSGPHWEQSTILVRRDGSFAPAKLEAMLLAGDQSQAVGFLVLVREQVDPAHDPADRVVRQERLATMGEMAAQLAHEMRNPLVAIGATLETLCHDATVGEGARAILATVTREIVRMDMTLKDYLAFRHDLDFGDVDLSAVLDDARRLLEAASRRARTTVRSKVPAGLVVKADYEALKHVFFNLLHNALEASPPDSCVTCSSLTNERDVSIVIEDQGPGLASSPAECFQPFFTTKKNGTGLGLTVCQKIARAHGGLVDLRNAEGGGCRASVVLPRHVEWNLEARS